MRSKDVWMALVLVMALGIVGLVGANATGMLASRPTAAAVVDVQAVFESLKEKLQIEANLKSQLEGLNSEEQNRKRTLEELKSDLEILAPDTPAYNEKQAKLEQRVIELQAWRTFQTQKTQPRTRYPGRTIVPKNARSNRHHWTRKQLRPDFVQRKACRFSGCQTRSPQHVDPSTQGALVIGRSGSDR